MSRILVLGPSEWDPERGRPPFRLSPLAIREEIVRRFRRHEREAFMLEAKPDPARGTLLDKFRDTVATSDRIVLFWPPGAKMQTTFDELLLLVEWRRPPGDVLVLHHERAARMTGAEMLILEAGGRSRYLEAAGAAGFDARPWRTLRGMYAAAERLAKNWA